MKTNSLIRSFTLIVFTLLLSFKSYASCNCGFLVDEVLPASTLCSSDGSITILTNEQFCVATFQWGLLLNGDTLENHFSGASGCSQCQYTFSSLRPGDYTIFRVKNGSPACLADEQVHVGGLPVTCESPYTYSIQQPSVFLCYDGDISLTSHSDCNWTTYVYENDTTNLFAGPFSNAPNGSTMALSQVGGSFITRGTYIFHSISSLPSVNGSVITCSKWDTVIVSGSCNINTTISPAACAGSHCNCSFKVRSLTNSCGGYYSELIPLGQTSGYLDWAWSGDTITYDGLYAQTYVVHTYPFSFGITPYECEQYDTVVIHASPCSSPYSISVQNPTYSYCPNGNITLTNTADCYWLSYLYKGDTTNLIAGAWDNLSHGTTFSLSSVIGYNLNAGKYYIKSYVNNQANFGQATFCTVWDTVILTGPCYVSATASSGGCIKGQCGCSINVLANVGCGHYTAELYYPDGTLLAAGTAYTGYSFTFNDLYPHTYIVKTFPNENNVRYDCFDYDTVVVQGGTCQSPYSFTIIPPTAVGCKNGEVYPLNHTDCFWMSYVYFNDTSNLVGGPMTNWLFDGNTRMSTYAGFFNAGTYYVRTVTFDVFSQDRPLNCEVWDTLRFNAPCIFNGTVLPVTPSGDCTSQVKFTAVSANCEGYTADLRTLAGSSVRSFYAVSGDTVLFDFLYPGTYVLHSFPGSMVLQNGCERFDTIVIPPFICHSPFTYVTVPSASGNNFCCSGDIILTNHSPCYWYCSIYQDSIGKLIFGTFSNWLDGGVIRASLYGNVFCPGLYLVQSFYQYTDYDGNPGQCETIDTVIVGVSCQLTGSVTSRIHPVYPSCTGGSITVKLRNYDCTGTVVNLRNAADSSVVSSQIIANLVGTVTFTGLASGNYLIEAYHTLDTLCQWWTQVNLFCLPPDLSFKVKVFIEGFYLGSGIMQATVDPVNYPMLCDTLNLELHEAGFPYGMQYSSQGTVATNGIGSFIFPGAIAENSYYLTLRHRNALETWSSVPVMVLDNALYDFTDSPGKAYGNNLSDLSDGNYALFSGDISDAGTGAVGIQDGVIESQDYSDMENAVYVTLLGYVTEDITGDRIVESSDYGLMENNVYFTRVAVRP